MTTRSKNPAEAAKKTAKVLMVAGGNSPEAEISRMSGKNVFEALRTLYRAAALDWDGDLFTLTQAIRDHKPDCIFNGLHGGGGENGEIQGFFEISGIPYTHSGVLASALAMNKPAAKGRFSEAGLLTPPMNLFTKEAWEASEEPFAAPYVVKPVDGGSSIGVDIVPEGGERAATPAQPVFMVEKYIPGRELSVGVIDSEALSTSELLPKEGEFYSYRQKYSVNGAEHITPAPLLPAIGEEAHNIALVAYECLGCRSAARVDLRFDGEKLWVLEVNTQPGMSAHSLLPEMAESVGIGFENLVKKIVEEALARK